MILAIQDANILIDLHNTGLLEHYFALETDTYTTDLVLQEVRSDVTAFVKTGRLKVKSFTNVELQALLAFKATQPASLSLEDCSVFHLAIERNAILLTGEKTLTNAARRARVEAHGILWLFDLMLEKKALNYSAAVKAMEKLLVSNHRLPMEECHKRLEKWNAHPAR